MKVKVFLMMLLMLAVGSVACADEVDVKYRVARKYMVETKQTITVSMDEAYRQNAIMVMGEGAPKKSATGGARRLTAITAAKVTA